MRLLMYLQPLPPLPNLARLLGKINNSVNKQNKPVFNLKFKGFSKQITRRILHFAVFLLFAFCYKPKR